MGFTKLFSDIVSSSIWNEDDQTRIVWITLLALKGGDNIARASVGGLAHQARVSLEDCQRAIAKLSGPDPDDRSGQYSGRRIEKVTGGFLILNGQKYVERRDEDYRREYMAEYMREYRKRKPVNVNAVNNGKHSLAHEDEESEKEKEKTKSVVIVPSLDSLTEELGPFSAKQRRYIADQWERDPDYVLRQATIVRSEPRANAAKAFLAALRDDWQPRKVIAKPKRQTSAPVQQEFREISDEERAKRRTELAELKAKVKGS